MTTRQAKKKWDADGFWVDMARLAFAPLLIGLRVRPVTPSGEKYRKKLVGGMMIAANHNGFFDPLILAAVFWYRRVYYLIGEAVMRDKLREVLLTGAGGIKVDRTVTDLQAVKKAVSYLKDGRPLVIFPQGGIVPEGEVQQLKNGAALMALTGGVPILPVYIAPRRHWYNRQTVVIGEPFDPAALCSKKIPSTADFEKISQTLAEAMNACAEGFV